MKTRAKVSKLRGFSRNNINSAALLAVPNLTTGALVMASLNNTLVAPPEA